MAKLAQTLKKNEKAILASWLKNLEAASTRHEHLMERGELERQAHDVLQGFTVACQNGQVESIQGPAWNEVRDLLSDISATRAQQGFSPSEVATFVFSLKDSVFTALRKSLKDGDSLFSEILTASQLLDALGLHTTEVYQKAREAVIQRQQEEMLELSTPVVKLWEGVLALPLIGTLDSGRTQVVMEALLDRIVETGATIAIIDITGVPTVDTLTAQHLIKTITAARLMGADCIISGIRPQIAQTIVHLGVDLSQVSTKATLADAFLLALDHMGQSIESSVING